VIRLQNEIVVAIVGEIKAQLTPSSRPDWPPRTP